MNTSKFSYFIGQSYQLLPVTMIFLYKFEEYFELVLVTKIQGKRKNIFRVKSYSKSPGKPIKISLQNYNTCVSQRSGVA